MKVLVCGSRDWTDKAAIRRELKAIGFPLTVIHGACRGADMLADRVALEIQHEHGRSVGVMRFPADWDAHGRAAGPIRNRKMLVEGRPELVLCFHADLASSKGSRDMVRQAEAAGVPVRVIAA